MGQFEAHPPQVIEMVKGYLKQLVVRKDGVWKYKHPWTDKTLAAQIAKKHKLERPLPHATVAYYRIKLFGKTRSHLKTLQPASAAPKAVGVDWKPQIDELYRLYTQVRDTNLDLIKRVEALEDAATAPTLPPVEAVSEVNGSDVELPSDVNDNELDSLSWQ